MSDDNVIPFPTQETDMTQEEYNTAMEELINTVEDEQLGRVVAGVLEFLTVRALVDGPYYILTENKDAITVFATNTEVDELMAVLPDNYKNFDEEPDFLTNTDPGDEQDESAPESE
jgi:hypothetical protein